MRIRYVKTNVPTKGSMLPRSILRVSKLKQVIIIHMGEREAENEIRLAQMSRVYPTPGVNLASPLSRHTVAEKIPTTHALQS